jgi:hypothetical protein
MTTPSDPPSPPQSRRTWPWMIVGVVGFAFAFVVGVTLSKDTTPASATDPTTYAAERAQAIAESEAWHARWGTPAPSPSPLPAAFDFIIDVKVLTTACFGSAGCNITYQIDPAYIGTSPLAEQTFTVIDEVSGGEDGPQINNFTVNGDSSLSFQRQEFISTSSPGATLKAKATSISEN